VGIAIEVVGWAGAACVLTAYALLSGGRLTGRSPAFHWLNIVGALGFVVNSGAHGALPSTLVNVVWAGLGLYGLRRLARARKA